MSEESKLAVFIFIIRIIVNFITWMVYCISYFSLLAFIADALHPPLCPVLGNIKGENIEHLQAISYSVKVLVQS